MARRLEIAQLNRGNLGDALTAEREAETATVSLALAGPGIGRGVTEEKLAEMRMCPVLVRKGIGPSSQNRSSWGTVGHYEMLAQAVEEHLGYLHYDFEWSHRHCVGQVR